jgi:hypothetical protein
MTKLNKVGAIPKRLCLLTLATLALATAVFAGCNWVTADCADGSITGAQVCCDTGETGYGACFCNWSASAGYFGCQFGAACGPDYID